MGRSGSILKKKMLGETTLHVSDFKEKRLSRKTRNENFTSWKFKPKLKDGELENLGQGLSHHCSG